MNVIINRTSYWCQLCRTV